MIKINTDLDNFIYVASHDLKSPISNLEGLMDASMAGEANTNQLIEMM
ncbi:MAG: hypothetical protein H7259_07665 [Cytophagales bacterium]|nr:hypothetical protein [Cytophaga sp.]